jgi:indole-3-glycerol phosphate synthase
MSWCRRQTEQKLFVDILTRIIEAKRARVNAAKSAIGFDELREQAIATRTSSTSHALSQALSATNQINIIAEFKRRSPSKGVIRADVNENEMARLYELGGAAAISVLTEEDYFAGSLNDLKSVKRSCDLPVLRKDFIFGEYQVFESAVAGADALLLIVAVLEDETLRRLLRLTKDEMRMDALVEVHTQYELKRALSAGATLIGINNRDLKTFDVSLDVSFELAKSVTDDVTLVSESGLHSVSDLRRLREAGFKGFLIGEFLMRATAPDAALRELSQA